MMLPGLKRFIPVLALLSRLYLGGLFLYACVHKILHPDAFAMDVATYQLLPLWSVNGFALTVPFIELVVGLLLVLGVRVRAAALVTSLLLVSFMVALGFALNKGLNLSCGCFASEGAKHDPISGFTLLRDTGWLVLGLFILFFDDRPLGLERVFIKRYAS
jgi:putative oxidoreductase